MEWTGQQRRAITERGKNIIVSAAAGSGKTAVLVERIKRLVMEEKVPIDRFLVVTFTKAAAAEMKEKLTTALRKGIRDGEGDTVFLRKQLGNMGQASISTFDSFALTVDREFFQFADLTPGLMVGDEVEMTLLAAETMEDLFAEKYGRGDPAFLAFLDRYSSALGEEGLRQDLLATYEKLRSFPHYFGWLDEAVDSLRDPDGDKVRETFGPLVREELLKGLKEVEESYLQAEEILARAGLADLAGQVAGDAARLGSLCHIKDLSDLMDQTAAFKAEASVKKTESAAYKALPEAKSVRDAASKRLGEIKSRYTGLDWEEEAGKIGDTWRDAAVLRDLLKEFEAAFRLRKEEQQVLDFADVEHYAIRILEHEEAASCYRDRFEYIFIDEYQDSNYLQEAIIGRICREDNLFMVGDVKQSIYGFRMAEPKIFLDKYERYKREKGKNLALDLNLNFRSQPPVIDTVNAVFERLMAGYDEDARLYFGAAGEEGFQPVFLDVLDLSEGQDEVDEELLELENQEWEALRACQLIEAYRGTLFTDPDTGEKRPMRHSDMVILMRSVKRAGVLFKEMLAQRGIGLVVEESTGYFDSLEVATFLDLLQVLDNGRRDVPLLSVLRSLLFGYSLEELIAIRLFAPDKPFYEAFAGYAEEGPDPEIRGKAADTREKLSEWRRKAAYEPIDEFLGRLLSETGYEAMVGALVGGAQRCANLRTLADFAVKARAAGRESLYDFIRYMDAVSQKDDVRIGQAQVMGEGDDVVRLTTIHKSKGLEYPLVIVAGLGRQFAPVKGGSWQIDREVGLCLSHRDLSLRYLSDTLLTRLAADRAKHRDLEEEFRVLYVACTRARNVLLLLGSKGKRTAGPSYLRYLQPIFDASERDCFVSRHLKMKDFEGQGAAHFFLKDRRPDAAALSARRVSPETREKVARALSYVYPYEREVGMKSKYAVTAFLKQEEEVPAVRPPLFMEPEIIRERIDGAALGTLYHSVLEHLDFLAAREAEDLSGYLKEAVQEMTEKEILLPGEQRALDLSLIEGFIRSDMTARMAGSLGVHKETPFTYERETEGIPVLVQGIIDCWFEEPDGLVLLDYKSNRSGEGTREYYEPQVAMYREALSALTGKPVKEAYLYMLRTGEFLPM